MRKKLLWTAIFFHAFLLSQNLNMRLTTTAYIWERQEGAYLSSRHLRAFQLARITISKGNILFRSFFNLSNDFLQRQTNDPRLRFYNFYIFMRNIAERLDLKIGRFPVYSGAGVGTIDGIYSKLRISKFIRLNIYGGSIMPYDQGFHIVENPAENYMFGVQAKFNYKNFLLSISYFNRHRKVKSYSALRSDSVGNIFIRKIETSSTQYQIISSDVKYEIPKLAIYSRIDYDVNNFKFSRAEISLEFNATNRIKISAGYDHRDPRIPFNSIFSVFNYGVTREVELSVHYKITQMFRIYVGFANVSYVDERAQRAVIGFDAGYGGLNFSRRLGFAGDLDGISGYFYYPMLDNRVVPMASISYASYKFFNNMPENEILTISIGGSYRPVSSISLEVQLQYLENKVYESDFRLFFKFNYWLFKKIKLGI